MLILQYVDQIFVFLLVAVLSVGAYYTGCGQEALDLAVAAGDSVRTVGEVRVYARPDTSSDPIGVQGAGAVGLVLRGPSERNSLSWLEVDFEEAPDGAVLASGVEPYGGGGVPDTLLEVVVFGCSNFSNLADGINSYSEVMVSNGGTQANSGKTIISYGEPDNMLAFEHVRTALHDGVDAVIAGLCHRYDYQGMMRPGARWADVDRFLPADSSGSTLYGELELVRRMALHTRAVMNEEGHGNLPLYMLALHDYDPAGSCARVGEHIPSMLRSAIAQMVAEGLVSEMSTGGELFALLPLVQPEETTSEGCHISDAGRQKLVLGNPDGGLDDWAIKNMP